MGAVVFLTVKDRYQVSAIFSKGGQAVVRLVSCKTREVFRYFPESVSNSGFFSGVPLMPVRLIFLIE